MAAPTVELSMIVKDGASTLARCLSSVAPFVDRIVLGDTGSADSTLDLARSFGAEIVSVPWQNDFSLARNQLLGHARCDWILVLDADEMLDPNAAEPLAACLAAKDIAAYDLWRWNYVASTTSRSGSEGALANPVLLECSRPYPAYVRSLGTRLFRRHPGIRFDRPVHEHVAASVEALGLRKALAPFVIHHFGQVEDTPEERARKNESYAHIGEQHLDRNPDDARTHFELGLVELEHRRSPSRALVRFTRACQLNPRDASAWLFAGICLLRLGHLDEALITLTESEHLNPASIVLQEALGDAHFHRAAYERATLAYHQAETLGATSALIQAKQGACQIHLGHTAQGLDQLHRALAQEPDSPELHDVASAAALLAGDLPRAAAIAARRTTLNKATAFHFALAAGIARRTSDASSAHSLLHQGLTRFPTDPELQKAAAQSLAAR